MAEFRLEAIAVLVLLLPGFLAAALEERLSVHREQSDLDRIIKALLYSFVTYVVFTAAARSFPVALKAEQIGTGTSYRVETDAPHLALLAGIALLLAAGMSFGINNDLFGRFFCRIRLSNRSWRDTIWSDVFHNFGGVVQIQLNDGRSVVGWLKYFSDRSSEASFFLEHAAWVGADLSLVPIDGPGIFLTKESGICSVSFLNWEQKEGSPKVVTDNESFVRWQAATVNHLGYAVNLFLSFATASLGFCLLLVKDKDFALGFWGRSFLDLSILLLIFSLSMGVWCTINRLSDFRKTAAIARDTRNLRRDGVSEQDINRTLQGRRAETTRLGKRTWGLFRLQIATFGCGSLLLIIAFAITYHSKLF